MKVDKISFKKPSVKNKLFDPKSERFQYQVGWYKLYPRAQPQMKGKRK